MLHLKATWFLLIMLLYHKVLSTYPPDNTPLYFMLKQNDEWTSGFYDANKSSFIDSDKKLYTVYEVRKWEFALRTKRIKKNNSVTS